MFERGWTAYLVALSVVLFHAVPVAAQDRGQVGLAMGYPTGIGVMVGVSGRVALRPEISFTRTSSEGPGSAGAYGYTTTWDIGVGLSAFLYVHQAENLRLFVSPRLSCDRSSYTWASNYDPEGVSGAEWDSWQLSGTFGAQYALSRRFSVFGDVGIAFTHEGSSDTGIARTWGPRAGFGVILFF